MPTYIRMYYAIERAFEKLKNFFNIKLQFKIKKVEQIEMLGKWNKTNPIF